MHGSTPTDGFPVFENGMVSIPEQIPIFPLPEVVLLPGEVLPLHIFEPRYRQMTEAALEAERLIGMVTVRPDACEEMGGNPPIYAVGCVGFINEHQRLPDGRYNVVLRGVKRFRVQSESAPDLERLYRLADARWLEDPHGGSADGRAAPRVGVLGLLRGHRRLDPLPQRRLERVEGEEPQPGTSHHVLDIDQPDALTARVGRGLPVVTEHEEVVAWHVPAPRGRGRRRRRR